MRAYFTISALVLPNSMADTYSRAARYGVHLKTAALGLLGLGLSLSAQAQQRPALRFFADDDAARRVATTSPLAARLQSARPLSLEVSGLRAALATAPPETRAAAQPLLLVLPLPDGGTASFRVVEASVMAPALAAQFPSIKTYAGVGVDDPTASVRLDLTPQGFHAQVLSPTTGDFFIDPATRTDQQHYLSFWRRDMPGRQFSCGTVAGTSARAKAARGGSPAQRTAGQTLRTYRLAVAATGEYTKFQGGTVALGQAAIVTSVNRVVGVYEKEMAVRMVLVAGNSSLVYTNGATDPYTNGNPGTLLDENQANVDALIGTANYDIGHVFSTAGGGLAALGVVCTPGQKAQGETGISAPVGDAFDIDYVAHEMGHQFGANHPFNGTGGSCGGGNRNADTAYEPGSGSTIMAYAGICGSSDDLQPHSNAYFHTVSYEEIQAYLATTSCAVTAATGNTIPQGMLPAGGKVLPIGTPFKLMANGFDADGDPLTFCWEEFDLGSAGSPTAAQVAGDNVPLFRSFTPTTSPTRYFPQLSNIIANTVTIGERLPTVTRDLKFRLTVRDQHTNSLGTIGGINNGFLPLSLSSTSAAGPFLVSAPNTAVTWAAGTPQTVTWAVAGTTGNGVNCATVNIRLSTDGGLTYPTVLLSGTANDGTEAVTLPAVASTTARIMVEAADNYFFDISNVNFTITTAAACAAPTALTVSAITRTTASVGFTPGAATSYVVTTSPATTTQTVTTSPVTLTGLMAGTIYTVSIVGSCAANATSTTATASFTTAAPPACNEPTNLVASAITGTSATVSFTASPTATSYTVTTSPATTTQTVTASPVNFTGLTPGTRYTVLITSNCAGGGTATEAVTFGTVPPNDNCTAAVTLTSGTSCVATAGTVTGATQSQAASTCSGSASTTAFDVWYTFVATNTSHTIQAVSGFDGVLELFRGSCGALTSVGCIDDLGSGGETYTSTALTVGTRYYVRYYPYNTAPVVGTFTICLTNPAPVCAAPTGLVVSAITGTTATVSFTANSLAPSYTVTTAPATTTQTVTASPISLTGLLPGTRYTVSVVSACSNGLSSAAATVAFTTSALPTVTAVSPVAELPGMPVVITGTGFTAASTVTIGGVAATGVTFTSATSLTAIVPVSAAVGSGTLTVTTTLGTAAGRAFEVLKVYDGVTTCLGTAAYTATGDGQWHYLRTSTGQVVAALQDSRAALGTVSANFRATGSAAPVRQDTRGRYYLDRNFQLTATGSPFTGGAVAVRFYGLTTELARLQAADATVSYATLKATQYSGANEDCDLANDNFATGEFRTLSPVASTPGAGVPWFVAQVVVADHFSEFYLASTSLVLATKGGTLAAGLTVFPNPARTSASVSGATAGVPIEVFDATGRRVATAQAAADGTARLVLPAGLAAGLYVVRSGTQVQRLAVE